NAPAQKLLPMYLNGSGLSTTQIAGANKFALTCRVVFWNLLNPGRNLPAQTKNIEDIT
ncbi:hypothetical protein L9F63_010175, partial [Diploptera punctata]